MLGGGLGNFSPGEWSDDTAMAVCIGEVAATGQDLTSAAALDAIAEGFLRWYDSGPADIGAQTRAVLGKTSRQRSGAGGESVPSGALMTAVAADLTHYDDLAADSCVIWSEAIRIAVVEGRFDYRAGIGLLPERHRKQWHTWIDEAHALPPGTFSPNGFTVTALQAAIAAIEQTARPEHDPGNGSFECLHLQDSLHAAVRIGDDTDTVAAITGGLLGARWGASAVPWNWRREVHGWPGLRAGDLVVMATHAVNGGRDDDKG